MDSDRVFEGEKRGLSASFLYTMIVLLRKV